MSNLNNGQDLYEEIQGTIIESKDDLSKLFNQKDVIFHKPVLATLLSFIEVELDELFLAFSDFPKLSQFLKVYGFQRLSHASDVLNDLEIEFSEYNFKLFSEKTKELSIKSKSSLLLLCQKLVKLINLLLKD